MIARIKDLERQVAELKMDLAHVTLQRDEAVTKAEEFCHMAVYAAEQGNRKGLVSIKCATD